MNHLTLSALRSLIQRYPATADNLAGKARWIAKTSQPERKTYEYFLATLLRLIRNVYNGFLGGEFIDVLASLISGQITQAYETAWLEDGTGGALPDYLRDAAEGHILSQFDFVDKLYRDIVDARVDGTSLEPLLQRAELWANQYTTAYQNALSLIRAENGEKEMWVLGQTEKHCPTCAGLNGIVAYAKEWEELGVRPRNAPNPILDCEGWRCDCELQPTDRRRSPDAYGMILNIVSR